MSRSREEYNRDNSPEADRAQLTAAQAFDNVVRLRDYSKLKPIFDKEGIKKFINHNPDIINRVDIHKKTLLMYSVIWGKTEVTRYLLEQNANVDFKNTQDGNSALTYSFLKPSANTASLLLASQANPNQLGPKSEKPLSMAAAKGRNDLILALLKANADIEGLNVDRSTPLMKAAQYNKFDSIKLLIKNKASIDNSAINTAIKHGSTTSTYFLLTALQYIDSARDDVRNINYNDILSKIKIMSGKSYSEQEGYDNTARRIKLHQDRLKMTATTLLAIGQPIDLPKIAQENISLIHNALTFHRYCAPKSILNISESIFPHIRLLRQELICLAERNAGYIDKIVFTISESGIRVKAVAELVLEYLILNQGNMVSPVVKPLRKSTSLEVLSNEEVVEVAKEANNETLEMKCDESHSVSPVFVKQPFKAKNFIVLFQGHLQDLKYNSLFPHDDLSLSNLWEGKVSNMLLEIENMEGMHTDISEAMKIINFASGISLKALMQSALVEKEFDKLSELQEALNECYSEFVLVESFSSALISSYKHSYSNTPSLDGVTNVKYINLSDIICQIRADLKKTSLALPPSFKKFLNDVTELENSALIEAANLCQSNLSQNKKFCSIKQLLEELGWDKLFQQIEPDLANITQGTVDYSSSFREKKGAKALTVRFEDALFNSFPESNAQYDDINRKIQSATTSAAKFSVIKQAIDDLRQLQDHPLKKDYYHQSAIAYLKSLLSASDQPEVDTAASAAAGSSLSEINLSGLEDAFYYPD